MECNRAIPNTICMSLCVCVMWTLTYRFRRWLVRTFPPWLFCVHCLRQYSTYTISTFHWLLMSLLLLCKFSIFKIWLFFFPKIVVIFIYFMNFYYFRSNAFACSTDKCNFKWFDICRRCAVDNKWQVAYWAVGNLLIREKVSYTNTHILNYLLYCCYYCRKVNFHPLVICYQSKFNRPGCIYFFFFTLVRCAIALTDSVLFDLLIQVECISISSV